MASAGEKKVRRCRRLENENISLGKKNEQERRTLSGPPAVNGEAHGGVV